MKTKEKIGNNNHASRSPQKLITFEGKIFIQSPFFHLK